MKTLTNSFAAVNPSNYESSVTRLARVSYAFVPIPQNIGEVLTPIEAKLYGVHISFAQRGIIGPCVRVLAAIIKRSERTVQRLQRSMERKGLLAIIERRISACRNAPNLYKLIGLVFQGGVGDKNVTEKHRKLLKTTTPAPERGAGGRVDRSIAALLFENRRLQDAVDKLRKLAEYTENGHLWAKFKERGRSGAARMASAASLGVWNGPAVPDSEWEPLRAREREREALRRAKERR
jgi:hypothetical protein